MKKCVYISLLCLFFESLVIAQNTPIENIIIVTTDGLRWQEVFKGMDSALATNPDFNQKDGMGIIHKYWAETDEERRAKLMPFLWSTVATNGQIYGNRAIGSKVNVSNPYWFSYPGYSEIFCGFVDSAINTNKYTSNPNTSVLEYINKQHGFKGKVAAFGAWDAYDRIFNEARCGFPVICGYDSCGGANPDIEQQMINNLRKNAYDPFGTEPLDVFTHAAAMDYLKKEKPRVLYISYGETDEWAHEGRYKDYLNAAKFVDKWLSDIWNFIQTHHTYKNNTLLFITVDHGRGDVDKNTWTSHNSKIVGADEIWFACIGPQILPKGEVHNSVQLYQKQIAQTIAELLGLHFTCEHPVSPGFKELLIK